jgi:hypothetical protein
MLLACFSLETVFQELVLCSLIIIYSVSRGPKLRNSALRIHALRIDA